jgi:hypothetical protein
MYFKGGNVCMKINIFLRERRRFGVLFFDHEYGDGMFLRKMDCLFSSLHNIISQKVDAS